MKTYGLFEEIHDYPLSYILEIRYLFHKCITCLLTKVNGNKENWSDTCGNTLFAVAVLTKNIKARQGRVQINQTFWRIMRNKNDITM